MEKNVEVDVHDVQSLFSSSERDYLVRNNGDQIAISTLKGKKLGIYFSASWCPPCQRFTPNLVDIYNELVTKGDFEIIFVSADEDEESFTNYFSKMPWLAVPFSDSQTRETLDKCFKVNGIPHLVFLDENGKLLSDRGVEIIGEYGSDGYPFTPERVKEIKDQEEEARKNQSLRSILESTSRDFVIKANGDKVPITELEGKTIGLYFNLSTFKRSSDHLIIWKTEEMSKDMNWNVDEINLKDYDLLHPQLLLPDRPICPMLVKLFMQVPSLTIIPPTFFEHMPILEVLDLSNTNIMYLPTSIASLSLLQEFFLRDCSALIELPNQVGMLSKLKLFDIKGTELMYLPEEMKKLTDLEVLRVSLSRYAKDYIESNSFHETVVPRNMISELKQLKELCITVCQEAEWWEEEVKEIQSELCDLVNLETLNWYLPTNEVLQQFLHLESNDVPIYANLSNLMLTIGQHAQLTSCLPRDLEKKFEEFRNCLKWVNAEGDMDDVSKIMESAEALFLSRHWTIEKLSTFNITNLKYCLLAECTEMKTLVDVPEDEDVEAKIKKGEKLGLELLQYLSIHHMKNLQSIWKGPIGKASLSKLTILALHSCPNLTSIFPLCIAQNLSCLMELTVEDCSKVTSLIRKESYTVERCSIFPSLERIFILDLPELVNIFGPLYWLLKVSTLLIYNCQKIRYVSRLEFPHLKQIQGETEWWGNLDSYTFQLNLTFVPLGKKRDLVEQLFEATNSLQHFLDIVSQEHKDDESYDWPVSEAPDKESETDVFYSFEDVDRFLVSGPVSEDDESYVSCNETEIDDLYYSDVDSLSLSAQVGRMSGVMQDALSSTWKALTEAIPQLIKFQDLPSGKSGELSSDTHTERGPFFPVSPRPHLRLKLSQSDRSGWHQKEWPHFSRRTEGSIKNLRDGMNRRVEPSKLSRYGMDQKEMLGEEEMDQITEVLSMDFKDNIELGTNSGIEPEKSDGFRRLGVEPSLGEEKLDQRVNTSKDDISREPRPLVSELSHEEFSRRVEAFIAKQKDKMRRDKEKNPSIL